MTGWNFCLAGLSEDPTLWQSRAMLLYLLLLLGLDGLAGHITVRVISLSDVFYLQRSGYQRWCRHILNFNGVFVVAYAVVWLLLTMLRYGSCTSELWIATGMFTLNGVALAWLQALLIIIFGNAFLVYPLIVFIQLISLYCSQYLSSYWKLLLPGNWAMAYRSSLATSNGFIASYAMIIELLFLMLIWHTGWRLVRWRKRRV